MMPSFLITLSILVSVAATNLPASITHVLGDMQFSLANRYPVQSVSDIFSDNILLTLAYMRGIVKDNKPDWNAVKSPFTYSFVLQPGEVFAFHDSVLPEFSGKVVKTTNAHFGSQEGFKSDGWLVADGVCHLASLINEAAAHAGLKVVAPTNHDFAVIPEIPKEYGTAIYYMPGSDTENAQQNLYVQNTKDKPVTITFDYKDNELTVEVTQIEVN
ncbi:MAG TPA: VanW family protein [Candidatus Eisenbacteria bacterium]|nr:VanW family protein [Candidatus Eisenbacteria bacterium]